MKDIFCGIALMAAIAPTSLVSGSDEGCLLRAGAVQVDKTQAKSNDECLLNVYDIKLGDTLDQLKHKIESHRLHLVSGPLVEEELSVVDTGKDSLFTGVSIEMTPEKRVGTILVIPGLDLTDRSAVLTRRLKGSSHQLIYAFSETLLYRLLGRPLYRVENNPSPLGGTVNYYYPDRSMVIEVNLNRVDHRQGLTWLSFMNQYNMALHLAQTANLHCDVPSTHCAGGRGVEGEEEASNPSRTPDVSTRTSGSDSSGSVPVPMSDAQSPRLLYSPGSAANADIFSSASGPSATPQTPPHPMREPSPAVQGK